MKGLKIAKHEIWVGSVDLHISKIQDVHSVPASQARRANLSMVARSRVGGDWYSVASTTLQGSLPGLCRPNSQSGLTHWN